MTSNGLTHGGMKPAWIWRDSFSPVFVGGTVYGCTETPSIPRLVYGGRDSSAGEPPH